MKELVSTSDDRGPVLFLDSGIGGLPYYRYFTRRNPAAEAVYIADREHFPYGKKTKDELGRLLTSLVENLIRRFHPALLALACNTASVSALAELRARFPALPFVGTVPAVRPAAFASVTGKIGVLGTERTIEDAYIGALAESLGRPCSIVRLAAPSLVEFVEYRLLDASGAERLEAARFWTARFREEGVDGIVLGCTHFLFLLDEFRRCAGADITIYDSIEGVCNRIESLLEAVPAGGAARERGRLWVTGKTALEESWQRWADTVSLRATLLADA